MPSDPTPTPPRGFAAPRYHTVLSLGSNLGDSEALVAWVVASARSLGVVRAVSSMYSTPPWGGVSQPDFRNVTMTVESEYTPRQWLLWGSNLEARAMRTREVRWGPRTLDVDVIASSLLSDDGGRHDVHSDDPHILLPHPRARERAFVLVPWLEIEPDAELSGRPIADWLAETSEDERAEIRLLGPVPDVDADEPPVDPEQPQAGGE